MYTNIYENYIFLLNNSQAMLSIICEIDGFVVRVVGWWCKKLRAVEYVGEFETDIFIGYVLIGTKCMYINLCLFNRPGK